MSAPFPEGLRRLCQILMQDQEASAQLSPDLIKLARDTRVLHLLAARPGMKEALGQGVKQVLYQAALGAVLLEELRTISQAMSDRGIPIVPLKGMAYALMFEQGGPTRLMDDIDLLVQGHQFEPALEVMSELGYQDVHSHGIQHTPEHHERTLGKGRLFVEIHKAFAPGTRVNADLPALWARTIPMDVEGISCRRLCPVDTLLFHCLHMGLHHFSFAGLGAIWELRQLVLEDRCDLGEARARAREWGVLRMTWCSLKLMEMCFPGSLPENELDRLAPSAFWRVVLNALVIGPSVELLASRAGIPRSKSLLRKALLMERVSAMPSYAWWYAKAKLFDKPKR